jgi:hypothetical protein
MLVVVQSHGDAAPPYVRSQRFCRVLHRSTIILNRVVLVVSGDASTPCEDGTAAGGIMSHSDGYGNLGFTTVLIIIGCAVVGSFNRDHKRRLAAEGAILSGAVKRLQ